MANKFHLMQRQEQPFHNKNTEKTTEDINSWLLYI